MVEAGIRNWFGQQLGAAKAALLEQGRLRGGMTVFYLLGPFFMLIERSPADAWLTLWTAFLVRCVVRRDWSWTKFFWVRAVWFLGLVPDFGIGFGAAGLFSWPGWCLDSLSAICLCQCLLAGVIRAS